MGEQQEETEEELTPPLHFSSSLDEAIMPPSSTSADDFRRFQELFHRIAEYLQIPLGKSKAKTQAV